MEAMYYFKHKLQSFCKFLIDLQSCAEKGCATFVSVGEDGKRMTREA
jgi:hypothetical protein